MLFKLFRTPPFQMPHFIHPTPSNAIPNPKYRRGPIQWSSPSQQIKVIQLLPVPQDIPLDLRAINPRHKVLHAPCNEECGIGDGLRADPDMALLDKFRGGLHRFGHAEACHDDGQPTAAECGHSDGPLDLGEFGARGGGKDAHVVQLGEQEGLVFEAERGVGGQGGQAVRELSE